MGASRSQDGPAGLPRLEAPRQHSGNGTARSRCRWYRTYLRCSGCRPGHHANKVSLCGYVPPQISCTLYMHRCTPVESPRGKVALWHTNAPGNLPRPGPNSSGGALIDQPFHPHHCSTSQIVSTRQNGPTIRDLQYRNSSSISPQSAAEPSLCRRNRCTETDSPGVATNGFGLS